MTCDYKCQHQARVQLLEQVLKSASTHVYRQQSHGKHEQDREDAKLWWSKFKHLSDGL